MPSVTFLVKSKTNPATIYVRLSVQRGKDYIKKTGLLIDPDQWSTKKKESKPTSPENKNLATNLSTLKLFIENSLNQTQQQGNPINTDWLQTQIDIFFKRIDDPNTGQSAFILDLIDYIIQTAHTRKNGRGTLGLSQSRVKSYQTLKTIFNAYQTKTRKHYKAKDIDLKFERLFLDWLINTRQHKDSYALKLMDNLKAVCNEANTLGIETSPQLPKLAKGTPEKELPIYLNPQELQQIRDCKITNLQLHNARKWLLLGCHLGQRGGDLLKIDHSNYAYLDNGTPAVRIRQQKTGKIVIVPIIEGLNSEILEIKNAGLPYPISIQRLNEYIKEVCKLAGIDIPITHTRSVLIDRNGNTIEKDDKGNYEGKGNKRTIKVTLPKYEFITSHVCRRSFATNLYGKLPTTIIKNVTGHSTEAMLLKYIGKNEAETALQMVDFLTSKPELIQELNQLNDLNIK
ncbi:tyrosine-type recombinase/integrase [Capnocytophaga cynodegmi]|uniref:Site-specific recombinase, phage integrase family n=1 Tax=Capnocytophaga cynodegmi TaxID=28189 RepID=A0A0B7H6K9_9FLAO|nr:phage integrase SAM-like domain-containing protein [Capnocytophaga cynodegmi]CEN33572.1 Site-specific recombinase, phage integrase family [Capnocytophaga cynodegmi]